MKTTNGLKWVIVGMLVCISAPALSQAQSEKHEWKTWVANGIHPEKIFTSPKNEVTQKELKTVKEMITKRDEKRLRQIQFWDAGAPSYRWNQIGYQLITPAEFLAPKGRFWYSPTTWMNIAIYDATVAVLKSKAMYQRKAPFEVDTSIKATVQVSEKSSYPCEHSATAAAAATVLAHFFPERADSLIKLAKEASESRLYAGVKFPSDAADGWKLGELIASKVIEQSKKHDVDVPWKGTIPNDPKLWRGEFPLGALITVFKPVILKTGNQFRPDAPPDFAKEMKEIKNFKQDFNSIHKAFYWANLNGLDIWTDLASQKIFEYRLDRDALTSAQIYTLLHVTLHDAAIAIMDAKYTYWGIRPDQYDHGFKPLLGFTPPFPGYPSGHATASAAAAAILAHFFPADKEFFKFNAKECADSRFYAGIHFQTDNTVGLTMGESIGKYILDNWKNKMLNY
jgi:membrane-associated phospholipid phosphatase